MPPVSTTQNPGTDIAVIQMTMNEPTANSKGLRLGSFDQIRGIIDEELEAIWAGDKTAQEAMDSAKERGDAAAAPVSRPPTAKANLIRRVTWARLSAMTGQCFGKTRHLSRLAVATDPDRTAGDHFGCFLFLPGRAGDLAIAVHSRPVRTFFPIRWLGNFEFLLTDKFYRASFTDNRGVFDSGDAGARWASRHFFWRCWQIG